MLGLRKDMRRSYRRHELASIWCSRILQQCKLLIRTQLWSDVLSQSFIRLQITCDSGPTTIRATQQTVFRAGQILDFGLIHALFTLLAFPLWVNLTLFLVLVRLYLSGLCIDSPVHLFDQVSCVGIHVEVIEHGLYKVFRIFSVTAHTFSYLFLQLHHLCLCTSFVRAQSMVLDD